MKRLFGIVAILSVFTLSCGENKQAVKVHEAAFSKYISGYTSNIISSQGEVVVRLSSDMEQQHQSGEKLFTFSPSVKGSEIWLDEQTVVFQPAKRFKSGTRYRTSFQLSNLAETPKNLKTFVFDFETIRQDLEVDIQGIAPSPDGDRSRQIIIGTIHTADVASKEEIRKVLNAEQNGTSLPVRWEQDPGRRNHHFTVSDIVREKATGEVLLTWNGESLGVQTSGRQKVEISSIDKFELVQTRVVRDTNPHIELTFSDLLDTSQNLDGLIRLGSNDELNFIIRDNQIEVYPRKEIKGKKTLLIAPGIRNPENKRLNQQISRTVRLFQLKPRVRLVGKGAILPNSSELLLPFEAASLGAVDVQITRIFENNILQFLQNSRLTGGRYRLNQVGRAIYREVVPLSSLGSVDIGNWNSYALDISKLIEPESGAIYQVKIGFRKHQALYPCGENQQHITFNADGTIKEWTLEPEEEQNYWNRFDSYYYPSGYDWRERDNPCHASYYTSNRQVSRNALASDLGLIVKRGQTGSVMAMVTDLKTTKPQSGVTIELYDYQQQLLSTLASDQQGMAEVETERKPYFLVAKDGEQRGYLKLDDGSSLSLSDFDVSGARVKDGIKGFLYGERDVWRPGDSLFVTLLVEDEENQLPENHPVTFELRNPSGQIYDRQVLSQPLHGFYSYRTSTGPDVTTGNWTVRARLGGNTFSKRVKIETIKPNRLKVNLNLNDDRLTASDRVMDGTISSRWLHGATAQNLDVDVSMTLFESSLHFEDYPGFTFTDPSRNLDASTEEIFKGKLNSQGEVPFSYTMNRMEDVPGKLRASLKTRVFEPSGNFSINRSGIVYYPYPVLVGLRLPERKYRWSRLDRDSTHVVDVVTVDVDGEPVERDNLEVQIYKVSWRWWWEKSKKNMSKYISRRNIKPVFKTTLATDDKGKGQFSFKIDDYSWGRFLVKVIDRSGGYSAGKTFYLGRSYGRNIGQAGSPTRLSFNADKESYEVGEEMSITFPSSSGGRALVSLETGSKVLQKYWVDTSPGETEVRILASNEMSPNVYAHIMMLQPHGQQENDRPIRMYGVIPIEVEDPSTELDPVIDMQDELRPETRTTLDISEKNGRAMSYTIAMVDEGLLDLTNYQTPDPHSHFYAREALGVKTWDLFDAVAGSYAGSMNRILSIGGDEEVEDLEKEKEVNRFKPMVRYLGPFHLEAGNTNQHDINIPNYVGSVRTMVIAGYEGAYGKAEQTTPVRKPVMVLGTLPRVLGPGEKVTLPVSVFAMKRNIRDVDVRIQTSDIFKVVGTAEKSVRFENPGDEIIRFELEVKRRVGTGRVEIEARSNGETAHYEIDIAVRNPNPPVTDVYEEILDPGEAWSLEYDPVGLGGTNSGIFEVSRIPPIDLGRRIRYLIRYPHGCIEQVTSSVFPQLFLDVIVDLSEGRKQRIEKNVIAVIKRFRTFQVPSGGVGYWPDHNVASEWGTSYAYHFLLEAKEKGYYVPSDLIDNISRYQRNRARSWRYIKERNRHDDLIQAYRLYTLALANTPELGAMNRLRERDKLSVQTLWRLAAAYVLAGQPEAADELVRGVTTNISEYRELSYTYGSGIRDKAMILETLSMMDRREQAATVIKEIAERMNSRRWMSTQTTAYSLIAISKFLRIAQGADKVEVTYDITSAGEGSISSTAPISQVSFTIDGEKSQKVKVTNNSDGIVFARLLQEGIPLIGDQTAASNNLVQEVKYMTRNGEPIDPGFIRQGMDIIAEVTVKNPGIRGSYKELALTQIFPSGWEITNSRMDDIKFEKPTSSADYQDIRDDRVYTYFDLGSRKSKTFRFLLNASYTGKYYLPTISTSAMYDESINARTPGQWVNVVLPE